MVEWYADFIVGHHRRTPGLSNAPLYRNYYDSCID